MSSPSNSLSGPEAKRLGWMTLVAVAAYLGAFLASDILPQIDQNNSTGLIVAGAVTVASKWLISWASDTRK